VKDTGHLTAGGAISGSKHGCVPALNAIEICWTQSGSKRYWGGVRPRKS